MVINSVEYKEGVVKIKYENITGDNKYSISSEELPDEDFTTAVGTLQKILVRALEIKDPEGFVQATAERYLATGVSISRTDTGDSYKLTGVFLIPHAHKYVPVETLKLKTEYDEEWWKKHDPAEWPQKLRPEDEECINKLIEAAGRFINGARSQKQLDFETKPKEEEKDPENDLFEK